ncbi:3-oxoacyl-ACP synthase [Weissella confusa]|nr:3-oxoacyl-ACP synthase [Weissella confusa]
MTSVITKMAITSALGEDEHGIHSNIMEYESGVSSIDYFDTTPFMANVAGNIDHQTWDKVRELAKTNNIDNSSALSIYTLEKLMKDTNEDVTEIGLSLGTCNGGIQSLADYYEQTDLGQNGDNNLRNYPLYKQIDDITDYFGFGGPRFTFNSACAASSAAIAYASQMIESGKVKTVIAGGSDPMSQWVFAGFNSLKTFNTKNATPYGENYGLNLGEAATFFIIKDKDQAIIDEDEILGEILGFGFTNDAHHPTAPDADGNGISLAIKEALRNSNVQASDVSYINSHGTGTAANDVAEFKGIQQVFGEKLPWVSSLKGYMGHNLGAAASTELALTLIGLKHNVLYSNYPFKDFREETRHQKILRKHLDLTQNVNRDFVFVNNSAAFGGHNSAVVFKVNLDGQYRHGDEVSNKNQNEVYINDIAIATTNSLQTASGKNTYFNNEKPLKEYNPDLYRRRMNELSQISIVAGSSISVENQTPEQKGLVFGTGLGSMNATTTYIDSIRNRGFGNASGIYFPDLVVNSTAGSISRALNLKGFAASISSGGTEDLKAIEIAFEALSLGKGNTIYAGSGVEKNRLTEQLLGHEIDSTAAMVRLSAEFDPSKTIGVITDANSFRNTNTHDLIQLVDKHLDKLIIIAPEKILSNFSKFEAVIYVQDGTGTQGIKALKDVTEEEWDLLNIIEISNDNEATIVKITRR